MHALWSGYGQSLKRKESVVCSWSLSGTGKAFGSAHREKSGKWKVGEKKEDISIPIWPDCTLTIYMRHVTDGSRKFLFIRLQPPTLTTPPSPLPDYFLAPLCLACITSSLLFTSHDSLLLPSLTVSFPLIFLLSCCGRHARTLTLS